MACALFAIPDGMPSAEPAHTPMTRLLATKLLMPRDPALAGRYRETKAPSITIQVTVRDARRLRFSVQSWLRRCHAGR
jgi:hypothetical protein